MKIPLLLCLLLAAPALRAEPLEDFRARVRSEYLKPFALDLGGVLGGASAHAGRTIGFPGFWAGILASVQTRLDKDDRIMRDSGEKSIGLPLLEIGVGLPLRFDAIVHGIKAEGLGVYGAGLRWGALRPGKGVSLVVPSVSISAFGDKVEHRYFSATHGSLNAAASWNLPIVQPFFVAGGDVTELKASAADTPGVAGTKATARGSRFSAGVEARPLPFMRLRGAYTLRHGLPGFDLGLGAAF